MAKMPEVMVVVHIERFEVNEDLFREAAIEVQDEMHREEHVDELDLAWARRVCDRYLQRVMERAMSAGDGAASA